MSALSTLVEEACTISLDRAGGSASIPGIENAFLHSRQDFHNFHEGLRQLAFMLVRYGQKFVSSVMNKTQIFRLFCSDNILSNVVLSYHVAGTYMY